MLHQAEDLIQPHTVFCSHLIRKHRKDSFKITYLQGIFIKQAFKKSVFFGSISWIISVLQPETLRSDWVDCVCLNHVLQLMTLTLISVLTLRERHTERGGGERIKSVIRVYSLCLYGAHGKALNLLTHTHTSRKRARERAVMNSQGSPLPLLFTFRLLIGRDLWPWRSKGQNCDPKHSCECVCVCVCVRVCEWCVRGTVN